MSNEGTAQERLKDGTPQAPPKSNGRKLGGDYRCPACAATVDARDMRAVMKHHRHVLYPRLYPSF